MQFKILNFFNCTGIRASNGLDQLQLKRLINFAPSSIVLNVFFTKFVLKCNNNICASVFHRSILNYTNKYKLSSNVSLLMLVKKVKVFPQLLKIHSEKIVQNSVKSFEFIVAHKAKRSIQKVLFYSKLWDTGSLRLLIKHLHSSFNKNSTLFMLSSYIIAYDWNINRITEDDILR